VYDGQGFLFLKKKKIFLIGNTLCLDRINHFSQNFQYFDEKSDPVMFILLLLTCVIIIAIIFSQIVSLFRF